LKISFHIPHHDTSSASLQPFVENAADIVRQKQKTQPTHTVHVPNPDAARRPVSYEEKVGRQEFSEHLL
jgi:hypothetical protein